MTDLSHWPYVNRNGYVRPRKGFSIPWRWADKFKDALNQLKLRGYAQNDSHAIVRAVIEAADNLRKEQNGQ